MHDGRDEGFAPATQRIKQADAAGEVGLRVDLEDIVSDETRHRDDLERILTGWEG